MPFALVESLAWRRRTTPWLGRTGLIIVSLIFVTGSALVFLILHHQEDFMATPAQRIGADTVVLALTAIAFLIRPRATGDRPVPRPGHLGFGTFPISSIFVAVPEDWTGFGLKIALTIIPPPS